MKIDLDTVTSTAIRAYADAKPGLESEIDAIKADVAASARKLNRSDVHTKLEEMDPDAPRLFRLTRSSSKEDLVDAYARTVARKSDSAQRMYALRGQAQADRRLASSLNGLVQSGEEAAAELREIVADHSDDYRMALRVTESNHWGRYAIATGKAASDLTAGYHNGKDMREIATHALRTHLAEIMRLPRDIYSNGFGGSRTREQNFVDAVAAREVINTIARAYQMDDSFTFRVFELAW
jgi:hypothetical protein